jgi:hypothetical protein
VSELDMNFSLLSHVQTVWTGHEFFSSQPRSDCLWTDQHFHPVSIGSSCPRVWSLKLCADQSQSVSMQILTSIPCILVRRNERPTNMSRAVSFASVSVDRLTSTSQNSATSRSRFLEGFSVDTAK